MNRTERLAEFHRLLTERILLLDGGMGTMIQGYKLTKRTIVANSSRTGPAI